MALRSFFVNLPRWNVFPLPLAALPTTIRCTTTVAVTPQEPSPPAREFYGSLRQLKSSPMKLNLVAKLIRGMNIGQALAQVQFCEKKAGNFVQIALLDTQRKAVRRCGVDPLNLWVAESFVGKGAYLKRIRYHGRGMHGIMHKTYAHYFLKLKEGKPPAKPKKSKNHRKYRTKRFIEAGPRSIPNSL